jgi:hypothetical protein
MSEVKLSHDFCHCISSRVPSINTVVKSSICIELFTKN